MENAHLHSRFIDRLGGTGAVARLCEVRPPSVSEWRKSGIPKARLMYLRAIKTAIFEDIFSNPHRVESKGAGHADE